METYEKSTLVFSHIFLLSTLEPCNSKHVLWPSSIHHAWEFVRFYADLKQLQTYKIRIYTLTRSPWDSYAH